MSDINNIFFNEETNIKLNIINVLLKEKCPKFIITLKRENSTVLNLCLELNKENGTTQTVSEVKMFNAYNDMIYINLHTEDRYRQNSFIAYLIAVLVLIGDTIKFQKPDEKDVVLYPARRIGLTAENWISGYELEKYMAPDSTLIGGVLTPKRKRGSNGSESDDSFNYEEYAVNSNDTKSEEKRKANKIETIKWTRDRKRNKLTNELEIPIDDRTRTIAQKIIKKFFDTRVGDTCLGPKIEQGGKGKKRTCKKRKSRCKKKRRTRRKF